MKCMYALPTDPQVQCLRPATLRFSRSVHLPHPLQGGQAMTVYAYTCDVHESVGDPLAERLAEAWRGTPADLPAPTKERLS